MEKSHYRTESACLIAPPTDHNTATTDTAPVVIAALPMEVSLGILTAAPPEMFSSRHFLSRTALPVRAPSLLA